MDGSVIRPPLLAARARRATSFETSPWSDAWDLLSSHPDGIYFGSGVPALEVQPVERLREAAARAWSDAAGNLDYGEGDGFPPLRELIAMRMAARGVDASPDQIMITNGSQQGIDLAAKLFIDPGDAIVVEAPFYIGAMQTFDAYEARYLLAPVDDQGLDVEALAELLDAAPVTPKLIYTVPTFQNPTGATMTRGRREALLDLAASRGIIVVEDDPYGELYFGTPPEAPLRALDPEVIYLGTFSKTIAPGLRVGWIVSSPETRRLLLMAKEGVDITTDRLATRTVFHTADGFLDDHVAVLRGFYQQRRDALIASLRAEMPEGVRWLEPRGGYFVWLELPTGGDADALLPLAAAEGIAFLPGSWFYPAGQKRPGGIRLSFSALSEDRLTEGIRRLGRATRHYISTR